MPDTVLLLLFVIPADLERLKWVPICVGSPYCLPWESPLALGGRAAKNGFIVEHGAPIRGDRETQGLT